MLPSLRTRLFPILLAVLPLRPAWTLQEAFVCPPCGSECHFTTQLRVAKCGVCGMGLVPLASVPQVGVLVHQDATITSGLQALAVFASSNAVRAFTVADTDEPMRLGDALEIRPQFALAEAPALDVLVLSDGYGVWDDALIVEWVKSAVPRARAVIAVGRAAVVLSRAGFLAGERVPAERFLAQRGKELAPELLFDPSLSYRRAGKFHLARDAASTLEASLAVLYELTDPGTAERTADALGLPFGGAAEAK